MSDMLLDDEVVARASIEEVALMVLQKVAPSGRGGVNREAFTGQGRMFRVPERSFAISEAWDWLITNGLLSAVPGVVKGWWFATQRALDLLEDPQALGRMRLDRRLDVELHSCLERVVRPLVLAGQYDMAVFAAMREVEMRVRELAGATDSDIGVPLMKRAFHSKSGPLSDLTADGGEREAMMALFWGAIGCFKNPSSHRRSAADRIRDADAILFADLLHRILDSVEERMATMPDTTSPSGSLRTS